MNGNDKPSMEPARPGPSNLPGEAPGLHEAWVEVDSNAIRHNFRQVKAHVGPDTEVMAVIKTNGYGHGLELVAHALANETEWFGVSTVEEGIRARSAAPDSRILVFHPCGAWNAEALVEHDLIATVDTKSGADALAEAGRHLGKLPSAHLKIDSGMSRFGVRTDDTLTIRETGEMEGIHWDGIYTHPSLAATRGNGALAQLNRFAFALDQSRRAGFEPLSVHALNSAGILRYPEHRFSLVRCGTLLYGQYPANTPHALNLSPTWTLKARIISLRDISTGIAVGYGGEWIARRRSRIATIGVGYADGPTLLPKSAWERNGGIRAALKRILGKDRIYVHTRLGRAPVVGRVAAQSMMLDITDLPGTALGDIVEIPSRRVFVGEHIPRIEVAR